MKTILKSLLNKLTKSTKKEHADIQNTPPNGNTIHNNESTLPEDEITTNEEIPNTPFRITGNPTRGYSITLGKYRLTEPVKTIPECREVLRKNRWYIITNMIIIMPEILAEGKRIQEMANKQ